MIDFQKIEEGSRIRIGSGLSTKQALKRAFRRNEADKAAESQEKELEELLCERNEQTMKALADAGFRVQGIFAWMGDVESLIRKLEAKEAALSGHMGELSHSSEYEESDTDYEGGTAVEGWTQFG